LDRGQADIGIEHDIGKLFSNLSGQAFQDSISFPDGASVENAVIALRHALSGL